nr:PREDICTED: snaclec 5-like [Stegastes partitus]
MCKDEVEPDWDVDVGLVDGWGGQAIRWSMQWSDRSRTGEGLSGEDLSQNTRWGAEEPDASSKKWHATNCFSQFRFVCYEDNLVVVNERKTWEDAVRHCREMNTSCVDDTGHPTHCYDLLSLTNSLHYGYVTDKIYRATTDEVWVGLRFLGGEWWWLNGEKPEDQGMLPNCPSQWKHCGSFSKYNTSGVNAQQSLIIKDCSERQNFICQKGGKDWENDNEFKGLK